MTMRGKSQSELKEAARAIGEMQHVDRQTIRDIIRRTQSSVMRGVATILDRTRPDLVVLFVAQRDLPNALAIPTTRLATQKDLTEAMGMTKVEAESMKLTVDTEGHVKFGEVFLCLRSRDVQNKVISEKVSIAMEPSRSDVAASNIRSRLPKSEAEETWNVSVSRRPPSDDEA